MSRIKRINKRKSYKNRRHSVWMSLPDEIKSYILSFLPNEDWVNCRLVCKEFAPDLSSAELNRRLTPPSLPDQKIFIPLYHNDLEFPVIVLFFSPLILNDYPMSGFANSKRSVLNIQPLITRNKHSFNESKVQYKKYMKNRPTKEKHHVRKICQKWR